MASNAASNAVRNAAQSAATRAAQDAEREQVSLGDLQRRAQRRRDEGYRTSLFLLTVALSTMMLSLYGAEASVFKKARAAVIDFFQPVLSLVAGPAEWVNDRVTDVQEYMRLHEELDRLRDENESLRQFQSEALTLRRELADYMALNATELPAPRRYINAKVIADSAGPYNSTLILSAGANDGVIGDSAVVDAKGLIGHISYTGKTASRVVSLTDTNSRVPVVIEPQLSSGAGAGEELEAMLVGRESGVPVLETFEERVARPLIIGQRVVTSGAGGMLPRGIPVGEIVALPGGRGGEERVGVALYANISTPNIVRVVNYQFAPELLNNGLEETAGNAGS